jgi:hypothetical protein
MVVAWVDSSRLFVLPRAGSRHPVVPRPGAAAGGPPLHLCSGCVGGGLHFRRGSGNPMGHAGCFRLACVILVPFSATSFPDRSVMRLGRDPVPGAWEESKGMLAMNTHVSPCIFSPYP